MADNAKKSADDTAEQKGRTETEGLTTKDARADEASEEKKTDSAETQDSNVEVVDKSAEEEKADVTATDVNEEQKSGEIPENNTGEGATPEISNKSSLDNDFQTNIREQIENVKFEIISSIQENLHTELKDYMLKQIRKTERRRRIGVIVRDVVILLLAIVVGYFGYCLYDAQYFDFMRPVCDPDSVCEDRKNDNTEAAEPEVVKDTAWYQRNYGTLFDSLQINLNADKVGAYYLYSDDYKVSEIQPNYLLAMAYNRLNSNITYDSDKGIMVPANDLKASFINLFGSADHFTKQSFTYDCAEFTYDRMSDSFITPSMQCNSTSNRQIIEEIDEIYEEGNAMYFLTTATIFDKAVESFYSFDNLFKPIVQNVEKTDFSKHKSVLNRYQYRFKKVDNKYYFSDIVKLK